MKKTFVIQVEYPDCDFVPSEEIMEVAQECIEQHLERHFGANIMDGDYDRIKVKEVTDGFSLVKRTDFISLAKRMREAQTEFTILDGRVAYKINKNIKIDNEEYAEHSALMYQMVSLESEVDEYLKKMEG